MNSGLKPLPDSIIQAILTDPADIWGVFRDMGLAELSAILSFAKRFDKRGDIVFMDDFECGWGAWDYTKGTGGGDIYIAFRPTLHGYTSLKLTSGSTGGRYTMIQHYHPYSSLTKMGFEVAATVGTNLGYLRWDVVIYTGTRTMEAGVQYDYPNKKLQYRNSGGGWTDFPGSVNLYPKDYLFHSGKLVFDPVNEMYTRFLLGKEEYDLSAYALEASGNTTASYVLMRFYIFSDGATNPISYVDGLVFTHNEPDNLEE